MIRLNQTLNSERYIKFLKKQYFPFITRREGYFQLIQDNAPPHAARKTQDWIFDNGLNVVNLPPYSPDLNPIENIFGFMKRDNELVVARTVEELELKVRKVWDKITPEICRNMIESMKNRVRECLSIQENRLSY